MFRKGGVHIYMVQLVCSLLLFTGALVPYDAWSQRTYSLRGEVYDDAMFPLTGAIVNLSPGDHMATTNGEGRFLLQGLAPGWYVVQVHYSGFHPSGDSIKIHTGEVFHRVELKRKVLRLDDVVVYGDPPDLLQRETPLTMEVVSGVELRQQMGGSLMQSLSRVPGVESMDIGSGHSKPVIRGLGFNRVLVAEHGLRHQGQQWGADHGLEVDQYAVDRVEVIKGPASLMYGSDALGGVVLVDHHVVPPRDMMGGEVNLFAASNNRLAATSVILYARRNQFHSSLRVSLSGFGDYRVPTTHVDIYSYKVPLQEGRLRNTAGQEQSIHWSGGFEKGRVRNRTFFSYVHSKGGFFAHAHGLEPRSVDTALHDLSFRDILLPFHQVAHTKVINHTIVSGNRSTVVFKTGYQHNRREEHSAYTQHGFMPALFPDTTHYPATLERAFNLDHLSMVLRVTRAFSKGVVMHGGVSSEYQQNRIDGRSFIIPDYSQWQSGVFLYGKKHLSNRQVLHIGVRYDHSRLHTEEHFDWFRSPVPVGSDTVYKHLLRSSAAEHLFHNLTWSAGYNLNMEDLSFRVNLGKGFRTPMAHELASHGVNYHQFSYQIGDPNINPEVSWQLDMGLSWQHAKATISFSPFVNNFTNYIYLNPTWEFDRLYGNGQQVYRYAESEVFRWGGEIFAQVAVNQWLTAGAMIEYVWSEQLSGEKTGYPLPFSPPLTSRWNLKATGSSIKSIKTPWIQADVQWVASQHRIVPPEWETPGYALLNLSAGATLGFANLSPVITLSVNNLFNSKYYRHTSYYRLINLPEPGRNVLLTLSVPFQQRRETGQKEPMRQTKTEPKSNHSIY